MTKAEIIDQYFSELDTYYYIPYVPLGELIVSECRLMGRGGLWVSTACTLIEQESAGRNLFGCDPGSIYCNKPVTKYRVQRLLKHIDAGGKSQGVGLTQLTYPAIIRQAESLGGAHLPWTQMRVGFKVLNDLLNTHDYYNAIEAYNDGNPYHNDQGNSYELDFARRHEAWKRRLNPAG